MDNETSVSKSAFVNPKNVENDGLIQRKSIGIETKLDEIYYFQDFEKKKEIKKRKRDSTVADLSIDIDSECSPIKKRSHKKRKRSSSKNTINNFSNEEIERTSVMGSAENVSKSVSMKSSKKKIHLSSDINNDNGELFSGLNNAENGHDTERCSSSQDTTRTLNETAHKKRQKKTKCQH